MSTNLKKNFTLTQLFILVLVANVISCKCGKNGDNQEDNTGKLTMEVAPLQLDPTKPATTVTFQLTEPGKKADLTKFQLRAHLTKQEDGTGSKLKYQDAAGNNQEAEKIDAPLTHFTSLTSLADDNPPLKIDFTVLADKNVTLLVYQIEAFDADNNSIGSFDVTYQPKKNQEVATLKLESNPQLEGNLKEIKLEVHNPSSEALAAGALKLQVKRTLGKDAIILGSMPTATPDTYELAINQEILATQSLHKTFMIDSQTDAKAAFEIQLIQAATPGNKTTVHWEKGAWIDLTVNHEGNPRQLTYSIINSGTKEIKHAKLQYSCGTTGIQLAGKALTKDQPEELLIGDLKVNKKIENQVLGAIDFGTNPNANFVCKVIYDGGPSEEKKISCTAADVQLSIEELTYDVATNQISYSIRNAGQDKADGVQMKYTNESKDETGKKVTINNQTTATEAPVNIPKTATTAPVNLPIDFKQADEATFKFELLYKGIVVSQTVTWKAQETSLKVTTISDSFKIFRDQAPSKLQIENMGNEVDTNKIIFRFINDKNVDFKIGNWSTKATGDTSLKNIINKERLTANEKIKFDIQKEVTTIPDLYGAEITVELLDETGISLSKQDLSWLNQLKIDAEIKPLVLQVKNFAEKFNEYKEEFENQKYTNWPAALIAIQAMIQLKSDLDGMLTNVSNLDFDKMHKALVEFIKGKVNQNKELIGKAHEQIITDLEYTKGGVTYFSEKAKNTIQTLKSSTGPQDQAIKELEKALFNMQGWLNDTATLANQYNNNEAQEILQEAQQIATETQKAAESTQPKPIIQEMIEHANKQGMWFTKQVLTKLQNGEMVDINEAPKGYPIKFTALWEVINNITSQSQYLSAADQDIIKALLDRGADLTIPSDNPNKTALDLAASNQHYNNMLKFLLDEILARGLQNTWLTTFKNNSTLLHMAANANIPLNKEISKLLEKNLDIEAKDSAGNTPLLLAVANGHITNIKLLLAKGAKTNVKNDIGYTPLIWAVMTSKDDTKIMQLLNKGAQINAPGNNNKTPLHYAVELNKLNNIKWLLDNGANVLLQDNDGKTAYDYISAALRDSKDPLQIALIDRLNPNKTAN